MYLVFTDLDGTLLDHETYSFEPALPALNRLKERGIPLILASSKTAAEMFPIAEAIGIDQPMIVENGAGVVNLAGMAETEDGTYQRLRSVVAAMPNDLRKCFAGFGDWSDSEVAEKTGMAPAAAKRARKRQFSEPGLWSGSEEQRLEFQKRLAEKGFQAVQGGRFFTLMPKTSKAERMKAIADSFAQKASTPVVTLALGDAPNDLAMLESADHGFIIANPAHRPLPETEREKAGFIVRSTRPGPAGWNDMILQFIA